MKKVKLTTITLALIASSAVAPLAANAEEVVSFDAVTEEGTAADVEETDATAPAEVASFAGPEAREIVSHIPVQDVNNKLNELLSTIPAAIATSPSLPYNTAIVGPTFPVGVQNTVTTAFNSKLGALTLINGSLHATVENYEAAIAAAQVEIQKVVDKKAEIVAYNSAYELQVKIQTKLATVTDTFSKGGFEAQTKAAANNIVELERILNAIPAPFVLTEAQEAAKTEVATALSNGHITPTQAETANKAIEEADSPKMIEIALAPVRDAVKLADKKVALKAEIEALTNSGTLLAGDAIALQLELAAATTQAQIDAVDAKLAPARQLQKAKDDAYNAIDTLVALNAITSSKAAYYKDLIKNARTAEEVKAILDAAANDNDVIFDTEVALKVLAQLHKDEMISDADYALYVIDVNEAKTPAAVANVVTNARNIKSAREAAKATLLDALAAGKITKTQYENAIKRIEAARYQSEIDAILAEYGLKADDTKPEPKPKPEPGKDKEDEGKEPGKKDEGKEPGKKDEGKAPGKDNNGSKPAVVTTAAKATLPQTGEELNGSIVAGGLMSMLTAAFLFFRRDRKAD